MEIVFSIKIVMVYYYTFSMLRVDFSFNTSYLSTKESLILNGIRKYHAKASKMWFPAYTYTKMQGLTLNTLAPSFELKTIDQINTLILKMVVPCSF